MRTRRQGPGDRGGSAVSRLAATFAELAKREELAFIPYQTLGYPTLEQSLNNLQELVRLGADIVEVGMPFSDPVADGPTIQMSSQAALAQGVTLHAALTALRDRRLAAPVVLMSYLNPLLAFGEERLFPSLADAGVEGLIVPDLDMHDADAWLARGRAHGVDLIFLLAPTSSERRIREVAERTEGFIYAVALTGTTGARESLDEKLPAFLDRIRAATDKPIVVGFGIARPEHVRALHGRADGVVVASRLLDAIRRGEDWTNLARALKDATRKSSCSSS
ncbi:MAG: tryptophan synthase subunit alpha [Planctomycetota bacterium]|nr:MAG: tryptophan synthase subunit alpha [Planctomycetota bacterium]